MFTSGILTTPISRRCWSGADGSRSAPPGRARHARPGLRGVDHPKVRPQLSTQWAARSGRAVTGETSGQEEASRRCPGVTRGACAICARSPSTRRCHQSATAALWLHGRASSAMIALEVMGGRFALHAAQRLRVALSTGLHSRAIAAAFRAFERRGWLKPRSRWSCCGSRLPAAGPHGQAVHDPKRRPMFSARRRLGGVARAVGRNQGVAACSTTG